MELISKMIKANFYGYYGTNTSLNEYKDFVKISSRFTPPSGDVYIHNCLFRECRVSGNGGAIYFRGSNSDRFLIEETTFISCYVESTSYDGGAVFLITGMSFLNRVCAYGCSNIRTGNGQCFYIRAGTDMKYSNHVNDTSICNYKNPYSSSYHTQYIEYGRVLVTRENISNNECGYYSALYSNSDQNTVHTAFSSFVNNTSNNYGCLFLGCQQEIHKCNILYNEQKSTNSPSAIYASYSLFIFNSCILENNKGKRVFYSNSGSDRIALFDCTLDENIFSNSRYYGSLTVYETNTKPFINGLQHLSTNLCEASFDSVGTLTATENKAPKQLLAVTHFNNPGHLIINALNVAKHIFINSFLPSD
jgi:hypothetical protein